MSSKSILPSSLTEFSRQEPIPGYVTQELIGRGGYGEVWRATAPGGLAKAIKIVYGDGDSTHAVHEMRALNRVKDVRHPLLLSIERVESVCGNLVVVTELGDGNLKDYFRSYREQEKNGIPQKELFGICRDVADALDYMYSEYSLQHLDVKPENILMVGGRAKLGDYGLVKNLYERSRSLVNGLTPTYSPPELFEGKPSRNSDQYSLAIVYIQMLTGELPFLAATTAQLATQHLQAAPDLSGLPKHQRPIVARALSKDPENRYECCRDLVDALEAAEAAEATPVESSPVQTPKKVSALSDTGTHGIADTVQRPASVPARESGQQLEGDCHPPSRNHDVVGQLDADALCPTVVVGVGSTGGAVVERFLTRIRDRVGPLSESSWLQALVIDADGKQLNSLVERNPLMKQVRTVPIVLQKPENYTKHSCNVLSWLDRRWFYNIPRDLSTAGLRPLGRLALVTHPSRVKDAISTAISMATGADAPADSQQRLGLPYQPAGCRVIIVGSIAGGTAGGTMLDLAYAVRAELKRRHLSDEDVHGVLLHSTPRGNKGRDRAIANTYATLREFNHYCRPGNFYPGEPALDVPPFHGDNPPFGAPYFVELGENLGDAEWRAATERVAEWLYCSNATPARRFLTVGHPRDAHHEAVALRSFDVAEFGAGSGEMIAHMARQAAIDVVKLWRDGRNVKLDPAQGTLSAPTKLLDAISQMSLGNTRTESEDQAIREKLGEFGLVLDELVARAAEVGQLEMGMSKDTKQATIERIVDETMGGALHESELDKKRAAVIVGALDSLLHGSSREDDLGQASSESLYDRVVARLAVRDSQGTSGLLDWIKGLIDLPEERIDGVRYTAGVVRRSIQELQDRGSLMASKCRQQAVATALTIREADPVAYEKAIPKRWIGRRRSPEQMLKQLLVQYVECSIEEVVINAVLKQLRVVDAEVTLLIERANEMSRQLSQLSDRLGEAFEVTGLDSESAVPSSVRKYQRFLLESLLSRRSELARAVEADIDNRVLTGQRGLQRFIAGASDMCLTLVDPLQQISRSAVLRCIAEINKQLIEGTSSSDIGHQVNVADILKQLVDTGAGDRRHVVIVPDQVDCTSLERESRAQIGNAEMCSGRTSEITLCAAHELPSVDVVADGVAHGIDMFKQLSIRLLTRVDVQWDPIETSAQSRPLADGGNVEEPATFTQTSPLAGLET